MIDPTTSGSFAMASNINSFGYAGLRLARPSGDERHGGKGGGQGRRPEKIVNDKRAEAGPVRLPRKGRNFR